MTDLENIPTDGFPPLFVFLVFSLRLFIVYSNTVCITSFEINCTQITQNLRTQTVTGKAEILYFKQESTCYAKGVCIYCCVHVWNYLFRILLWYMTAPIFQNMNRISDFPTSFTFIRTFTMQSSARTLFPFTVSMQIFLKQRHRRSLII